MELKNLIYSQIQDIRKLCEAKRNELFINHLMLHYKPKEYKPEEIKVIENNFLGHRNQFTEEGRLGLILDE
jgi:hypothetical protein